MQKWDGPWCIGFVRDVYRLIIAVSRGWICHASFHTSRPKRGFIPVVTMFTDQPVTPARLECVIDLLREHSRRAWSSTQIADVLQPKGLPNVREASDQAGVAIRAGVELGIFIEEAGRIKLFEFDRRHT